MGPGGPPGLQNRVSGGNPVQGGFDSHTLPPRVLYPAVATSSGQFGAARIKPNSGRAPDCVFSATEVDLPQRSPNTMDPHQIRPRQRGPSDAIPHQDNHDVPAPCQPVLEQRSVKSP